MLFLKKQEIDTWYNIIKNDRMISVGFQGKPHNITVIQVYAATSDAKEAKNYWFYEYLQDVLELTPKTLCFSSKRIGMQK